MSHRGHDLVRLALSTLFVLLGVVSPVLACPLGQDSKEGGMGRDDKYRRLFAILDSAEAALKQQPSNIAAQVNYQRELEAALQDLRASPAEEPSPVKPPATSGGKVAERATADPPGGPVTPSTRPSSKEDEQRRRDATAKFRGGGPLGRPYEEKTLRGVPEDWLRQACDRALHRSGELLERLTHGGVRQEAIASDLRNLRSAVEEIARPADSRK